MTPKETCNFFYHPEWHNAEKVLFLGTYLFLLLIDRMETPFNKYLYVGFVLVGLFQGLFSKDLGSAMSSLCIALAFNPRGSKN